VAKFCASKNPQRGSSIILQIDIFWRGYDITDQANRKVSQFIRYAGFGGNPFFIIWPRISRD
jgi:hypothetical protein